ncbi:sugar ABC transporter ATP-binding protein [Dactylosporangium sp. NPDC005572]|uniref:sugar ABC transporter ATP-binding protein n=1 Tax=Dactylosporangium sp. NPDC005572 TaxID=3156889 RepID=UPI0033B25470
MNESVLQLRGISKRFPAVVALDHVSMRIDEHEVVGLVGENGAGKSTLLKILAGVYQPDSGEIALRGRPRRIRSPRDAARAGIGTVHQEQSLVASATVAENILLGAEGDAVRLGLYRWKELNRRAQVQLDKLGLAVRPTDKVLKLSYAQRQMVEIAKALHVEQRSDNAPVIVLDEPTSVLEGHDLETLFQQIERLRQIASVIFVSHRLNEILRVSDRVYVLKDGACVAERTRADMRIDELYQLMVGRETSGEYYRENEQRTVADARELLVLRGLGKRGAYRDVSLTLREGEVLGLAGVIGSGREELCRTLFGAEHHDRGELILDGRRRSFSSPAAAVRAGIGYVPAERRLEGVATGMSVAENILLADRSSASIGPIAVPSWRKRVVADWIDRLHIRTPSPTTDVSKLSGGNQQKVVLAKWLSSARLKLLVLDHPTRGLDVAAKEDVYRFIRQMCSRGLGIVLLADTTEETIALSHSLVVMKDGALTARFDATPGSKPTEVELVERMV